MTPPIATYRLQFREAMNFPRAAELAPYLARLGVDTLYASPLMQAVPGSTHGYDGVDYNRLESSLGGREGFEAMSDALRVLDLGLLLDIVPNHLAASPFSPWWRDVLEWGAASRFADHFAIDWTAERLLVPVLGTPYGTALDDGDLRLSFDSADGGIYFAYFDIRLPLTPPSYAQVLARLESDEHADLARRFVIAAPADAEGLKAELTTPQLARRLPMLLERLDQDREALHALHETQVWRLAHWRLARETLTYRRFFEIADLVGIRVENAAVFDDVHRLTKELVEEGRIDGLRIDHIDGLADPRGYLRRLDAEVAGPRELYVVVEKILGADEDLADDWQTSGTTGYEFIARLVDVFVDSRGLEELRACHGTFIGDRLDPEVLQREIKRRTISRNLAGELEVLTSQASALLARSRDTRDLGPDTLRRAVIELIAAMPVYRTYVSIEGVRDEDRAILEQAADRAQQSREVEDEMALDMLVRLLCLDLPTPEEQVEALAFASRFQQSSAPVMAKAVEDTLFYRFSPLIALNEVGGDPAAIPGGVPAFHDAMSHRREHWPDALSTTATHDTKRGEDSRARLYGLSEMPQDWAAACERWRQHHAPLRQRVAGVDVPDLDLIWMFYQALAGAWPTDLDFDDKAGGAALAARLDAFMIKAVREAKLHTSWTAPDSGYEEAVRAFVVEALTGPDAPGFLADFVETCRSLFVAGALIGLGQTLLKLAAPGVPDIYQGAELWDLSLVDPDNRRPVDFSLRTELLALLEGAPDVDTAVSNWRQGLPKLHLVRHGLALRRREPSLFARGDYRPLRALGRHGDRVLAFARSLNDRAAVAVCPRLALDLVGDQDRPLIPGDRWQDTRLLLESSLPDAWTDVLTGVRVRFDAAVELASLLNRFPVALLISD